MTSVSFFAQSHVEPATDFLSHPTSARHSVPRFSKIREFFARAFLPLEHEAAALYVI
jgi:hypothetical protein